MYGKAIFLLIAENNTAIHHKIDNSTLHGSSTSLAKETQQSINVCGSGGLVHSIQINLLS